MILTFSRSNLKPVSIILAILFLCLPILAQDNADDFAEGMFDGRNDGRADASVLWLIAGLGCGCIGVGAAYLITPSPPADKMIGKTTNYVIGYSEGYKKGIRGKQTGYAAIGWIVWIAFFLSTGAGSTSSS